MHRFFLFQFLIVFILSCQSEVRFASVSDLSKLESIAEEKPEPLVVEENPLIEEKPEPLVVEENLLIEEKPEPPKPIEYTVTLKPKKKRQLDILFVLDTSASMDHHLSKLGNRVFSLLDSISDYDWQMAFTTSDHGDHEITKRENKNRASSFPEDKWEDHIENTQSSFGQLMPLEAEPIQLADQSWQFNILNQRILKPETPNYKDIFFNTVSHFPEKLCDQPPFCQKPMEQPLRSLKATIERVNLDNRELFRPGADFVSLIISNERERLEDTGRATSAQEVIDVFNQLLKPMGKRFFAFNILILDRECQKREQERGGAKTLTASLGLDIGELADLTGGGNISICTEDYGPALQKVSQAIEMFVEQSLDIEEAFDPSTFKVEFLNGSPVLWELAGNRLIFKQEIKEEKQIKISYFPIEQN